MLKRILLVLLVILAAWDCPPAFSREITVSTFNLRKNPLFQVEEVLREAYGRLGHSLKIIRYPAERALIVSNSGEADGELVRVDNIEKIYSNLIKIPVAISTIEFVAFTKDETITAGGWENLAPYRVGYCRGVKAVEQQLPANIKTFSAGTYRQLFHMLDTGRVEVVLASRSGGMDEIQDLELEGIRYIEPPLIRHELYHYVHRKNADLVAPLTRVLQEMTGPVR